MTKNFSEGLTPTVKNPTAESPYQQPTLVPIGNLHDLLAGATGPQCDQTKLSTGEVDDGTC